MVARFTLRSTRAAVQNTQNSLDELKTPNPWLAILWTVFVKVLETRIVPLAIALSLNPSPKKGEGLQFGPPASLYSPRGIQEREKGLGDEGEPSQKCPNYCG